MARSRNIKPGFFKNEHLGELDPLARILFAGLWCMADKEGRLEDRPKRIRIEILPYDDCDVDELLTSLHEARFIQRYAVNGSRFIQILKWKRHQTPHHKEVESEIPPDNQGDTQDQAKLDSTLGQDQTNKNASCPTDSLNSDSLNSDSKGSGTDVPCSPSFERFWNLYPKKIAKPACAKKWKAKKLDRLADRICKDVEERSKHDKSWLDGFTPNPLTYLNQGRWTDEWERIQPQPSSRPPIRMFPDER